MTRLSGILNLSFRPLVIHSRDILLFIFCFIFFSEVSRAQTRDKSIILIIDETLKSTFETELQTFVTDLEAEKYQVIVTYSNYKTPEEVRSYLQSVYATTTPVLKGAILFGKIPLARQYFHMTYANPQIEPTDHNGLSTQFFSDLDGNFYKDNPSYPDSYSRHDGNRESEIWVSVLPWFTDENTTVSKIREYLNKNHKYRSSDTGTDDGFLDVNEFYKAASQTEYNEYLGLMRAGPYSWNPFTGWGNVGLYINNSIGEPGPAFAYKNELQSKKYRFTSLEAHGYYGGNGLLITSDLNSMKIQPAFVWLTGCNTANLDHNSNFATELVYNNANSTLVVKGGSAEVGGLGNNENGFFGKSIATAMLSGKSLGDAYLYYNHTPLIYPWSESYELHNAFNIFIGDLSLTLYKKPRATDLILPANETNDLQFPVDFEWHTSRNANLYHVQIASDINFDNIIFEDSTLSYTSLNMDTLPEYPAYFWRVKGKNNSFEGSWSPVFTFSINSVADSPVVPAPDAPLLSEPANHSSNFNPGVELIWQETANTEGYRLQVSKDKFFSKIFLDSSNITRPSIALEDLQDNATYYWRSKAYNRNRAGEWSEVWDFTTKNISGMDDSQRNESISVYPNPVTNLLTIDYPSGETIKITFFSLDGQILGSYKLFQDHQVDLTSLKNGVYFLLIATSKGEVYRKIIKE